MYGFKEYKEQSINTMTNEELLILLYDELIKLILRAEMQLAKEDYVPFEASIDRCTEIITYLDHTLDRKYPISHDLHRLYDYFCYELSRIKIGRNKKVLGDIKPMLTDLRDSFRNASKAVNGERLT